MLHKRHSVTFMFWLSVCKIKGILDLQYISKSVDLKDRKVLGVGTLALLLGAFPPKLGPF